MTIEVHYSKLTNDNILHQLLSIGNEGIVVKLDRSFVTLNAKVALLHGIVWQPYIRFGLKVTKKDVYFGYNDAENSILSFSPKHLAEIQDQQYRRILGEIAVDYCDVLKEFGNVISKLWNFVNEHLSEYADTISASKLYHLLNDKRVQSIVKALKLDNKNGAKACELKIQAAKDQLIELMATRGAIPNNPLIGFMETGSLKPNMLSQMILAYGLRSDIDDTVQRHIIKRSSLQGLRSTEDFATEYLSAKKSMWFSKNVIRNTQYSARKHKLLCASLPNIYPGDCGTPLTVPFYLNPDHKKGYLYKDIVDRGRLVTLTPDVIDKYLGKDVQFKSPTVCKYTDGACEACCGRNGGKSIMTYPKGFHLGEAAACTLGGEVSQSIMSTKHLIWTDSVVYQLPDIAKKFFMQYESSIYANKTLEKNMKRTSLVIPRKSMGPLSDLNLETIPTASTYSQIDQVAIYMKVSSGEFVRTMFDLMGDSKYLPYLSEDFLKYIHKMKEHIVVDQTSLMIPLNKWDADLEMFNFVVVDDDMVAYSRLLAKFTANEIRNYTSISAALRAYTDLLYRKTSPNIFYAEIMIRALMITEPDVDYSIPVVHDVDDVHFGTLSKVISGRSPVLKMGFQDMGRYLQSPATYMVDKPGGIYDVFLGGIS